MSSINDPLIALLARAGAGQLLSTPELDVVLTALTPQLEAEPSHARLLASVAHHDTIRDVIIKTARAGLLVDHLSDRQRDFAEASYDELTDAAVVADPDPILKVLSVYEPTTDGSRADPLPTSADGGYSLFPHQRRALRSVMRYLRGAEAKALLHMPTGAGKTRTAMNAVAAHLRENEPTVVVWAAATNELVEQAAAEFAKAWESLGDRRVRIGHGHDGGLHDIGDMIDGCLVTTLQGLHSLLTADKAAFDAIAQNCTLMVFDEAHQAIAPTFKEVSEALSDRARLLGLSATPGRTADGLTPEDRQLAEFFTHRKVILDTGPEGYDNPVRYLIAKEYLAEPTFRFKDLERNVKGGGVDPVYVAELALMVHRLAESENRRRIMLFAHSVAEAQLIAAAASALGVPGRYVSGAQGKEARAAAIRWFKQDHDEPRLLTNHSVLTTGFDEPSVDACVVGRPTKSLVLYSQMIGRAIRGVEAGGTKEALIITVIPSDSPSEFRDVAAAFKNWEANWNVKEYER